MVRLNTHDFKFIHNGQPVDVHIDEFKTILKFRFKYFNALAPFLIFQLSRNPRLLIYPNELSQLCQRILTDTFIPFEES